MEITLVARGRDHMVNTPPQILLYEALGAKVSVRWTGATALLAAPGSRAVVMVLPP